MFQFMDYTAKNVLKDNTKSYRYGNLVQSVSAVVRCSQSGKSAIRILTGPGGAGTGSQSSTVALQYVVTCFHMTLLQTPCILRHMWAAQRGIGMAVLVWWSFKARGFSREV
jgi:hypothetical protein